jgi:hypothetical protein
VVPSLRVRHSKLSRAGMTAKSASAPEQSSSMRLPGRSRAPGRMSARVSSQSAPATTPSPSASTSGPAAAPPPPAPALGGAAARSTVSHPVTTSASSTRAVSLPVPHSTVSTPPPRASIVSSPAAARSVSAAAPPVSRSAFGVPRTSSRAVTLAVEPSGPSLATPSSEIETPLVSAERSSTSVPAPPSTWSPFVSPVNVSLPASPWS